MCTCLSAECVRCFDWCKLGPLPAILKSVPTEPIQEVDRNVAGSIPRRRGFSASNPSPLTFCSLESGLVSISAGSLPLHQLT